MRKSTTAIFALTLSLVAGGPVRSQDKAPEPEKKDEAPKDEKKEPPKGDKPATPAKPKWKRFKYARGKFAIAWPLAEGEKCSRKVTPASGPTPETTTYVFAKEGITFSVMFFDYPKDELAKKTPDVILGSAKTALGAGAKKVEEKTIEIDKHPGRELEIEDGAGRRFARVYLVNGRFYSISVVSSKVSEAVFKAVARKYADSFLLIAGDEKKEDDKKEAAPGDD